MARPIKSENSDPARDRIAQEFWKLLKSKPLSHIRISELVEKAGCNRSTFYYYFDDIDDLAWKMISESLPVELPKMAQACFTGKIENMTIGPETMRAIEQISMCIGKDGSSHLTYLAADALKEMWITEFQLEDSKQDEDLSALLDFMACGIVGAVGRYGRPSDIAKLTRQILLVHTLFSEATLSFIEAKRNRPFQ